MGIKANVLVGVAEITLNVGVLAKVVGYTSDGVTMAFSSTFENIEVEEIVGIIKRPLTGQEVTVTLNMSEGDIASLAAAIPGSSLSENVLTIGGADLQSHRLTLVGTNPAKLSRVIVLTEVNPTGEVAIPYKKGPASIIPVVFSALVSDDKTYGSVFDAEAEAPTLVVGANTKSNDAGTAIEAKFSKDMANPAGKHLEFWFTEVGVIRAFSAASVVTTTITLTVQGSAIAIGAALNLFYALGTISSVDKGVLASFSNQTVVPRPA